MSRRAVLAATLVSPAAAARAFDLPPYDTLAAAVSPYDMQPSEEDAAAYAAKPNPDQSRQPICASSAILNGDLPSLQAMADGGWHSTSLRMTTASGRFILPRKLATRPLSGCC